MFYRAHQIDLSVCQLKCWKKDFREIFFWGQISKLVCFWLLFTFIRFARLSSTFWYINFIHIIEKMMRTDSAQNMEYFNLVLKTGIARVFIGRLYEICTPKWRWELGASIYHKKKSTLHQNYFHFDKLKLLLIFNLMCRVF